MGAHIFVCTLFNLIHLLAEERSQCVRMSPQLLGLSVPSRYNTPEILNSFAARQRWLIPDLQPLLIRFRDKIGVFRTSGAGVPLYLDKGKV